MCCNLKQALELFTDTQDPKQVRKGNTECGKPGIDRKMDWKANRAMGPKGKAACSTGLDRTLDKSKQNTGQLPALAKSRPRRRLGRVRPSTYSTGALAPQEPPKSRECLTSSGQDRENRTREVLV